MRPGLARLQRGPWRLRDVWPAGSGSGAGVSLATCPGWVWPLWPSGPSQPRASSEGVKMLHQCKLDLINPFHQLQIYLLNPIKNMNMQM